MEAGLVGARGPAVIKPVAVDAPSEPARVPALRPKMEGASAPERRTRSNPATPNHVVRLSHSQPLK